MCLVVFAAQEQFDREFGRRLEDAFDREVMEIISIYNASPLRILPAKFEAFERYFTIESGFTDHAEPICNSRFFISPACF